MITVFYSCGECGLEKVPCEVQAREPHEDVVAWFQQTLGPTLSADHRRRSPHCHPKELKSVMVPTTGTDYIGGPTKH